MKNLLKRIHSTAPVRICDIGGWTDTWFAGHGSVFNIGVKPYVEVRVEVFPQDKDECVSLNLQNFNDRYSLTPGKITYDKHPLIEATIDSMEIPPGISLDINLFSELPPGASIGTSAAVCVALTGALDALTPGRLAPYEIARLAHRVESEKLGLQSGIQDQLCCAFGGFNFISIESFPRSVVSPLVANKDFALELERRLALIYIGTPHNSSKVHEMVIADLGDNAAVDPRIEGLRRLAVDARDAFLAGNLELLGEVMNRNTSLQRELHPGLVCGKFEELMEIAGFYKTLGCKVNGAGGDGGSVTILCDGDMDRKKELLCSLKEKGFASLPVSLSPEGVTVSD
ncbi:MAG: GHMP kinase [bacterium]|nr:GHMP kinase [bacterium]